VRKSIEDEHLKSH
jgi:chromosome segregation ATPase